MSHWSSAAVQGPTSAWSILPALGRGQCGDRAGRASYGPVRKAMDSELASERSFLAKGSAQEQHTWEGTHWCGVATSGGAFTVVVARVCSVSLTYRAQLFTRAHLFSVYTCVLEENFTFLTTISDFFYSDVTFGQQTHGFGATNMSIYLSILSTETLPYSISILREVQNHTRLHSGRRLHDWAGHVVPPQPRTSTDPAGPQSLTHSHRATHVAIGSI